MKELRLLAAVLEDTAQAARWYDEAGYVGLGERFLAVYYRYHGDWAVVSLVIHAARDPRLVRKLLRERKSSL